MHAIAIIQAELATRKYSHGDTLDLINTLNLNVIRWVILGMRPSVKESDVITTNHTYLEYLKCVVLEERSDG